MIGKLFAFLLYCSLIAAAACGSNSEATRQSAATPQTPSPQQSAPASSSNTQTEQQQQQQTASAGDSSAGTKFNVCALLTSAEIQEVQGEAVKETKSNERSGGTFAVSQCFYTLPTFVKSVSLEVTQSNPAGKSQKGLKEFWKERFHPSTDKDKKGERDSEEEEERGKGREEEEEESKPLPVSGIGEDAFWVGNRVAGALYVLKNNAMVRISIGGRDEPQTKINKSKALAQKAIQRL